MGMYCSMGRINVEAKFYERVHQLEREFAPVFDALHAKRKAIVTGEYEPTDEECNYPIINGLTDEEIKVDTIEAVESGISNWHNAH
uniref:Uncharacterized protein n=1 Tax=Parascaris equorum TaxID=6256 RepID=A0A914RHX9_PAREQ